MPAIIKKLRSAILVFLTHQLALPVLRLIRKPEVFPYTLENLHQLPAATLGKELGIFLDKRKLPLLPYYVRHDMKHLLLGYDTTDEGEVCLQCFMLGNRHISFPVVITVVFGLITMLEYWKQFRVAYQRGKKCNAIADWDWFQIVLIPVDDLKNRINTIKLK